MQLTFNNRMDQAKGGIYFEPDFRFGISQAAGFGMPNWYKGHQKRLKLDARVTFKIFEDCLANRHPVTGWQLTPRMNTTCFKEGEEVANRRLDHELTLGFPKTVSVMGLVANDTRIITSFGVAAYQLLWLAARFAQTRVRQDQRNEVRLTPSAFSRLIRRMTNQTFVTFCNICRVREACRLLIETDLPVTRIAGESGFDNLSNFNRRFRQRQNMTPLEYRGWHNRPPSKKLKGAL